MFLLTTDYKVIAKSTTFKVAVVKNSNTDKNNSSGKKHLYINSDKSTDRSFYFLNKEDEKRFEKIKEFVEKNDFFKAYGVNEKITSNGFKEAISIYITSKKYLSYARFTKEQVMQIIDFNSEYSFLSVFGQLNMIVENSYLENIVSCSDVKNYFNKFRSKNINVRIKLFTDLIKQQKNKSQNDKSNELKSIYVDINQFWINNTLNDDENDLFYQKFGSVITDVSTVSKIELKVFNKVDFNKYLKYLKSQKYKTMFDVITQLKTTTVKNLKFINKTVVKELQNNEALLYSKALYYRKIKDDDAIVDMLLKLKESSRYAKYWWNYRNILARNLIGKKEYKKAYNVIIGYSGSKKGNDYLDSEWMAGWIACDFLKDYNLALQHFFNYRSKVFYPQTITRGDYWIAKCYEKLGNNQKALEYYEKSEKYPMAFYAQISHYSKYNILSKIDKEVKYQEIVFPTLPEVSNNNVDSIDNDKIVKLMILYYKYLYERDEATAMIKYVINNHLKQKGEIVEFVRIIETFEDEPLIVMSAKQASYKLVFFLNHLFPKMRMINKKDPSITMIHSIIKQESGFVPQAISSAGAIGFMQIMPATAKILCKQLKITYNKYKLEHDVQYNIKLGKYYIENLINEYEGSKVLAVAAYNAGPKAVKRWLDVYGDLRRNNSVSSSVTWIESIDYKETRNYVQRVLENLLVYEYLLANE